MSIFNLPGKGLVTRTKATLFFKICLLKKNGFENKNEV